MSKTLANTMARLEKALGIGHGDDLPAGPGTQEVFAGAPYELVPWRMPAELQAIVRQMWEGAPWAADAIACLDEPQMVRRGRPLTLAAADQQDRFLAKMIADLQAGVARVGSRSVRQIELAPAEGRV